MSCVSVVAGGCIVEPANKGSFADRGSLPRIIVADDQEEILRTVVAMLEGEFQIVGLAQNGKEVIDLLSTCFANVLVLDLFMPEFNGIETARYVKQSGSTIPVIIFTVYEDLDFVQAALSVGVRGYVLKPHIATDLIPAIQTVLRGQSYISPCIHFG